MRMVLPIHQIYLWLALRWSCQIGLSRVCKPHVGQISGGAVRVVSTARVERAPSERARSASTEITLNGSPVPVLPRFHPSLNREWPRLPFSARIERPLFHRGGSASKKGAWPLPSSSFLLLQVLKHISGTSSGRSSYRRNVYVFAD